MEHLLIYKMVVQLLLLLFRHSAKSLNAQEERLIRDTAPPATRDSSEVARVQNQRRYLHIGF